MKNEETARRLREALLKSGYSQQELADKAGISKVSVSQYINGTHVPGNKKAGLLAKVLGCDPMWLMGIDITNEEQEQPSNKRFSDLLNEMSNEEKEDVMNYMQFIISKRK